MFSEDFIKGSSVEALFLNQHNNNGSIKFYANTLDPNKIRALGK